MVFRGRNGGVPLQWSRITWSCLGGMEDRKVTAVIAAW